MSNQFTSPLLAHEWRHVYESGPDASLIEEFYRPFLALATRYDRLAGYLSLRGLADALEGVDSLLETDGTVRIIAGTDLRESDKPLLLPDADAPLTSRRESQLAIIATLLDEGRLTVKVAEPAAGTGLFHPKLGIAEGVAGNRVTFEGSVNETPSAWHRNYERLKVHRSWVDGEAAYVDADVDTFERLWENNHPAVEVHDLNQATAAELVSWKPDPDDLDTHVDHVRSHDPSTTLPESAAARTLANAGREPGGLHLAEDISPVDPWPHQRVISDTAVSIYPNNLMLCDEVGLGKTIEAGLTLSRLVHTDRVEDALLLVPAGLVQQWQEELKDKFNLHAFRHDRRAGRDYLVGPNGDDHALDGHLDAADWSQTPLGGFLNARDDASIVIASWHTARRDDNRGLVTPDAADTDAVWDATVVDEAHSAREGTNLYDLLTRVEGSSRAFYALTATPMQLDVGELYDLLRLCDLPESWADKNRFKRFFETRGALTTALEAVGNPPTPRDGREAAIAELSDELEIDPEDARDRVAEFAELVHDHVTAHPGYDDRIEAAVDDADLGLAERRTAAKLLGSNARTTTFDDPRDLVFDAPVETWRVLVAASEWATPVQTRIFRNTRTVLRKCQDLDLLSATVPKRDVETRTIDLGDARPLYDRVESYISNVYKQSQQELTGKEKLALGFVMTTYRQRLTSSLHAAQRSLHRRYETLQNRLHDDADLAGDSTLADDLASLADDPSDVTEATINAVVSGSLNEYTPASGEGRSIVESELAELAKFIGTLEQTPSDPKLAQLQGDITALRREARDNIIIFTQYEDTLDSIRRELVKTHPNVGTYTGDGGSKYDATADEWTTVSKERIKREFTDADASTNILVCTDAASEGLNLQTADALVNYDLPWNPMRVEQRIGRIDRIGQENEVVKILNYTYEDTVEGDIYERLEERLTLFEDVVGTMRPVLNGLEADISDAVMAGEPTADLGDAIATTAENRNRAARDTAENTGLADGSDAITSEADLVDETKLDGWGDQTHPDIANIGNSDRNAHPYDPLVSPALAQYLLTQSEVLANKGWSFTALRRQDATADYPGTADDAYILQPPETETDAWHAPSVPDTAQSTLAVDGALVVTFTPEVAENYPSIELLLPGHPLFNHLLDIVCSNTTPPPNFTTVFGDPSAEAGRKTWTAAERAADRVERVALVATTSERVPSLPTGISVPSVDVARDRVREWCLMAGK